jgi:hypothetical protein
LVNPHAERWEEIRRANRDQGLATRLFRVVGPHAISGKCTGETVELESTRAQADALIRAGHLEEIPFEAVSDDTSDVEIAETPEENAPETTPKRGRKAQS